MASAKDTFESKTFAANTFAAGVWRGAGVTFTLVGHWSNVIPCNLAQPRIGAAQSAGRVLAGITQGRIGADMGAERVDCRTGGRIEVEE